MELFGFKIERLTSSKPESKQSIVPPANDDGTQVVSAGGYFGSYVDIEGTAKSEADLVRRYREVALHPECDMAIEDIINEAIAANNTNKQPIELDLSHLPETYSDKIKQSIRAEFDEILRLLNFGTKGHDIFRRWYVDGRLFYHKVIDTESPRKGISELRYIDPRKIKKVREIQKTRDVKSRGIAVVNKMQEYYVFNERGISPTGHATGVKIAPDSIAYVVSGLVDQTRNMVLSYLHKAVKPVNQLRMIEDAVVIYRIARAPERRIFYIDVGNLPKVKAEAYLKDVMTRYRNKLVYDASTGEIRDDRQHMSMLEDFWLPRREGGRGTEITTLPGGQNLGEIADIEYFQKKLYRSLNVPISRLESGQGFNLGRASEITRDELKFTKFVQRLRKKFTDLFQDLLRTQLLLKGVITIEDWDAIAQKISYSFLQDGFFSELKESEILRERIALANEMQNYVGKYFSSEYIRRKILKMNDRDIEQNDDQIAKEKETQPTDQNDQNIDNIG